MRDNRISEIGLSRTGCYGRCPVYSVIIQSDGSFLYKGRLHVNRLGEYTGKVHQWNFHQLARFIIDSGFINLQDKYLSAPIDLPSMFLTIVIDGSIKEIENYGDSGPIILWAIAELIDKLLLEAEWD